MLRSLVVLLALNAATASGQDLVFSLRSDLPDPGGTIIADEELLILLPGGGSRVVLPRETLNALVGDSDGNGFLDDAPVDIDACHIQGPLGGSSWLLSTTTTLSLPGGTSVTDGDVFLWDGSGQVDVLYPESFFESIAGTSAVDVDAIAIGAGGEIYFSFAEDETTTEAGLIAENGGNPVLDEQVVLRYQPSDTFAHVHFTKTQVVSYFATAVGSNFTTVVDTTGIACDPAGNSGDLMLVCGSTSQSLRGRVVSSRAGGVMVQAGGSLVDPTLIGLGSSVSLDALSVNPGPIYPVLRALPASGSATTGGLGTLRLDGLAPGDVLHLVATEPLPLGTLAFPTIASAGFGAIYPDPSHPMWNLSLAFAGWQLTADALGEARFNFTFQGLTPGTQVLVQAIRLSDLNLTNPIAVSVLP